MKQIRQFTGIIEREGDGYVSFCPELDMLVRVTRLKKLGLT